MIKVGCFRVLDLDVNDFILAMTGGWSGYLDDELNGHLMESNGLKIWRSLGLIVRNFSTISITFAICLWSLMPTEAEASRNNFVFSRRRMQCLS